MASQKELLLWMKAQGMRWTVFAMKTFLPYFLYMLVRKSFHLLVPANLPANLHQEEQDTKEQDEGEEKGGEENESEQNGEEQRRPFLLFEEPVPDTHENRRLASTGGTKDFSYLLRCLRDSFPDHEDLFFGWGNFRASGSLSLTTFPDFIKQGSVYVSMENPLLGRKLFNDGTMRDSGYFRIALYNTANLNRGNFSLPVDSNDTRLRAVLRATRTTLKPYRKTGEHILYALQVPQDTSLTGLEVFSAAQHDLVALRSYTSRPIILTASPAILRDSWVAERIRDDTKTSYLCLKELCEKLEIPFHERFEKDEDSSVFLRNCWCVVCHSSGFACDAVMAGVPAITLHRGNFVYPICSHELSEVENPKMPDRIPWFSRLAYCQWTLEEIARGEVWRHFQPSIESLLDKKMLDKRMLKKGMKRTKHPC